MERYYSVGEISKAIAISETTIIKWIRAGNLKAISADPHTYLINREDLKTFITSPPKPRFRAIIALIDKNTIKELVGEVRPKKKHKWGGYSRTIKPIGWVLP